MSKHATLLGRKTQNYRGEVFTVARVKGTYLRYQSDRSRKMYPWERIDAYTYIDFGLEMPKDNPPLTSFEMYGDTRDEMRLALTKAYTKDAIKDICQEHEVKTTTRMSKTEMIDLLVQKRFGR